MDTQESLYNGWLLRARVKRWNGNNFIAVKMCGLADRGSRIANRGGESENAINLTMVVRPTIGVFFPFRRLKKHPVYGNDERLHLFEKVHGLRAKKKKENVALLLYYWPAENYA